MLHLLPEQQKNLVLAEYHKRIGITISLFVIVVVIGGLVLLLPSYIVSHGRFVKVEAKKAEVEDRLALISNTGSGDAVKNVADRIAALASLGASINASAAYDQFLGTVTPGIQVTHLGYLANADKTILLEMEGNASNREALLAFADSINTSKKFTSVQVPLSSLRSDKNISFSFKLGFKSLATSTPQ